MCGGDVKTELSYIIVATTVVMFTKLLHAQARAASLFPNKKFSTAMQNNCTLL